MRFLREGWDAAVSWPSPGARNSFFAICARAAERKRAHLYAQGPQLRKVLLVEDDAIQLRVREIILKAAGFEVWTAAKAETALPLLLASNRGSSPDSVSIIITDHLLPGIGGVEFVRRIRAIDAEVPVVVLSGLLDAWSEYEGLNIIFKQKPCPPDEIISLVKRSFDHAA